MEVGTFRIYCHFCVKLRHLTTSWRFCTENMYFCFTWYFLLSAKSTCILFFPKVLLIFESIHLICVEPVHQSKYWYGVKKKNKNTWTCTFQRLPCRCFLSICFYSTQQQSIWNQKLINYQQQYFFVSVNEHHCMIVQNQNSCISIKSLFPAFVRVYLKTINYHFFWRGLG